MFMLKHLIMLSRLVFPYWEEHRCWMGGEW